MILRKLPKQTISCLVFACLPLLLTGCQDLRENSITGRLWSGDEMINHYQPATNANLRLFHDPYRADFLAQYDEENEKDGHIRRRAFFVRANESLVAKVQKPHFEDLKLADTLEPIPLESVPSPLNSPSGFRAQLAADGQSFTLFQNGTEAGSYHLPTYADKGSEAKRLFLTPAAVVVDVVIVAAIAGVVVVVLYAEGGGFNH